MIAFLRTRLRLVDYRRIMGWIALASFLGAAAMIGLWWRSSARAVIVHTAPGKADWARNGHVVGLDRLTVHLAPNATVNVGRQALAQPARSDAAEDEHLEIERRGDTLEQVAVRRTAARRKLDLTYQTPGRPGDTDSTSTNVWEIRPGDSVTLGGARIDVAKIDGGAIELRVADRGGSRRVVFGTRGLTVGEAGRETRVQNCRIVRVFERRLHWWLGLFGLSGLLDGSSGAGSSLLPAALARDSGDRLVVGGELDCARRNDNHLALRGLPLDSLRLVRREQAFHFAPGSPPTGAALTPRFERNGVRTYGFSEIRWPLRRADGKTLRRVIIGRTTYDVSYEAGGRGIGGGVFDITFTPREKVNVFRLDPLVQKSPAPGESDKPEPLDLDADQRVPPAPTETALYDRRMTAPFQMVERLPLTGAAYLPVGAARLPDNSGFGSGISRSVHWMRLILVVAPLLLALAGEWLEPAWLAASRRAPKIFGRADGADGAPRRLAPRRRVWRSLAIFASVALALAPEAARYAHLPAEAGPLLDATILNWTFAAFALAAFAQREYLTWLLALGLMLLAAFGCLTLLALATDADTTYWSTFFIKHKVLFLDVVPPWIILIALLNTRQLRPLLHRILTQSDAGVLVLALRWGPAIVMLAAMLGWVAVGGQTGMGEFSPIEFGKIATAVILASVLVAYDPTKLPVVIQSTGSRAILTTIWMFLRLLLMLIAVPVLLLGAILQIERFVPGSSVTAKIAIEVCLLLIAAAVFFSVIKRARRDFSPAIVEVAAIVFIAIVSIALIAAPVVQSDYSPVLIMACLVSLVLILFFIADLSRWLGAVGAMMTRTAGIPQRFVPMARGGPGNALWRRMARRALKRGWTLGPLAAVLLSVFYLREPLLSLLIGVSPAPPPQATPELTKQVVIEKLRQDAVRSTRPTIVGRFISWHDLDEPDASNPKRLAPPVIQYRDLGLQVLRARAVIADAACRASSDIAPAPKDGVPGIVVRAAHAASATAYGLWSVVGGEQVSRQLCSQPADASGARQASGGAERRNIRLLDGSNPVRVPVVQFDFTGAFFIARFGVATAVALMATQAFVIILGFVGFLQLLRPRTESDEDAATRRFLGLVLASAVTLFGLHWLIAWSNVLGLLPVMGQPMTWISAGASHHMLMALPCVVASLLALRYAYFRIDPLPFNRPPAPGGQTR
ncbi:MAG: hypothetical protein U1E19_10790 [Rhodoblastus sp.]